jgi:hypothetical protein
MARDRHCEEWDRMMEDWRKFSEEAGSGEFAPHLRGLFVTYFDEEPDATPPSRRDYSRPFWAGTPVE